MDGENIPKAAVGYTITASLGNRKADLLIRKIPPVVTTETFQNGQKPIVEFRLIDSNTNKSFSEYSYQIRPATTMVEVSRLFNSQILDGSRCIKNA